MRPVLFLLLFVLASCGSLEMQSFPSLSANQPKIIAAAPSDQTVGFQGKSVELEFDRPIDSATVTPQTFIVTEVGKQNLEELVAKAQKGDLSSIKGEYAFAPDGKKIQFIAAQDFSSNQTIAIIATTRILSVDKLPLNQTPGDRVTPFCSTFTVAGPVDSATVLTENPTSGGLAQVSSVPRPTHLVLNEILYDVVGTDTEGNLFIELLGDPGSNLSSYSVFISRANDGAIQTVLTIPAGFTVGTDGFFVIADAVTGEPAVTNVVGADFVKNFDPPNSAGCIQLVDPEGKLIDALGYGSPVALRGENNLFCFETAPVADVEAGISLNRIEGNDTDDNSIDWIANKTPSPGGF